MAFFDWETYSKNTESEALSMGHINEELGESFEFENMYDGLGEILEETKDDMNEDTFGVNVEDVGRDFDFSTNTQKMADIINKEQAFYKKKDKIIEKTSDTESLPVGKENEKISDIQYVPYVSKETTHWREPYSNMRNLEYSLKLQTPSLSETSTYTNESRKKHFKGYISLEEVEAQFFEDNKRNSNESAQDNMLSKEFLNTILNTETKKNIGFLEHANSGRESSRYDFNTNSELQYSDLFKDKKYKKINETKLFHHNQDTNDMSQYDGLMNESDKNFINRIQLSQLVSDDPYSDDFYYYSYNSLKNKNNQQKLPDKPNSLYSLQDKQSLNFKNKNNENPILKIQQQIQNIVAAGKVRPKATQLSLEGALGKISFSTVRTPRQILSVKKPSDSTEKNNIKTCHINIQRNHKFYLYSIEKVYDCLLEIDEILRKQKQTKQENCRAIDDNEQNKKIMLLKEQILESLHITEPIPRNPNIVHPFISIISYNKGKKLIPRIFEYINSEQKLTILTMITIYLDHLDVVVYDLYNFSNESRPEYIKENIDTFTQVALPSLLAYVSEASLQIIIELLSIMLERMNLQMIAITKIGLSFLTMFISRAEIIKQSGQADESDLKQWRKIYDLMFSKLIGRFIYIFPPSLSFSDEIYPWQFMAACAISSTLEQQHILVTEVREKVMDNVISSKHLPPDIAAIKLGNVNLFLHALGLDIEQLNI
ncbi:hypothetical protein PNEG_00321 [Pneumocystis murina B123]|uniref:mRNA decay factor PAT1 domain-containing protein n=1 Tax=Pneumocystis murina (strain B123) TaxID=1069680 RepID=M7NVI3_PNEMU|nr:hypothetical protein PNEG_00321 [Pneumocystis murina B123]EMR11292.1 hypothetical protein PNEG_00321 [Pneumocystis murina B123]